MLVIDLGQSGSRIRFQGKEIQSIRGKLNGENVVDSLRAILLLTSYHDTDGLL